jgi:putative membrane protein
VNKIKNFLILVLKGAGMGAANVIPGVSGGTVALITGIFEELIDAIKSFNLEAIKLIFSGRFRAFAKHVNLSFLIAVFLGIAISILSLARLLDFLFSNYPVYIWAYFFGLILASLYFVGKTVNRWKVSVVITFIIGTLIA